MRFVSLIVAFLLAGCSGNISIQDNPEPVNVTANVTAGGKALNDVKFNFQPTGDGLPAVVEVKEGKFEAKITPGNYTYFLSAGKAESAFAAVPAQYREGSLERQFTVAGGETLEFKLD